MLSAPATTRDAYTSLVVPQKRRLRIAQFKLREAFKAERYWRERCASAEAALKG